jgi:outer membrane protein assembly factor BamB
LRGPHYDGVSSETELAAVWPERGPPLLWTRELGQGYSGFIVAGGKIYTQRQSLAGQYLVCLHPDTGETVWEHRYDWSWQPRGAYPGPYATPTWHAGKIFCTSPTGLLVCVDAATGQPLWSFNVRERFKCPDHDFGFAASPLVEDDKVIVPVGGAKPSLVAVHVDDGRTVWTAGEDPASYCSALPITFAGRRCVVGYLRNALILADMKTGQLLYRHTLSSGYDEHSAWPLYREPHLFLAAPFRVPAQLLELRPGPWADTLSAKTAWSSRDLCNDIVSSVLYENHIYGFDLKQLQSSAHRPSRGTFKCLDWSTGKVKWSTDRVGQAGVLIADGKLILMSDTGELILAAADPREYRELARFRLFAEDTVCWTPPTLSRGRLFVRGGGRAVCVFIGRPENLSPDVRPSQMPHPERSWHIDAAWLMPRERDYPNDAPTWDEMRLWYGCCILCLGGAAFLNRCIRLLSLAIKKQSRVPAGPALFWTTTFVLGFLGPNAASAWADRCLFTWPVCLYAAFHLTLQTSVWAVKYPEIRTAKWLARTCILALVLVMAGYFELCKNAGMFIGWYFLIGFAPAFPFTAWTVFLGTKKYSAWLLSLWTILAFTIFFWSAQGLFMWKSL